MKNATENKTILAELQRTLTITNQFLTFGNLIFKQKQKLSDDFFNLKQYNLTDKNDG